MLDHEIYDVVLSRAKEVLEENVIGNVYAYKDYHHYHFWIQHPTMGNFHYKVRYVDEVPWDVLSGDRIANIVMRWHKECTFNAIFKVRSNP